MIRWLIALAWALFAFPAAADVFRPAYLMIEQTAPDRYDVLWKVPALDERTVAAIHPVFPVGTRDLTPQQSLFAQGARVTRWTIEVEGGLQGKEIRLDNLSRTGLDGLARYRDRDGTEQVARLNGAAPGFIVRAHPGRVEVALTYTRIGIQHILEGVDHLLFVLALVLLVKSPRRLVMTVSAFTLAHSITLALATLGVLKVPGPPVEATIALSIMFVAAEILSEKQGRSGIAARKPWIVAFSFGLLHGLGFAGALAEIGLPPKAVPLALLFFNVGVEIGQLLFIGAILALMWVGAKLVVSPYRREQALAAAAYVIGGIACMWLFERASQFV